MRRWKIQLNVFQINFWEVREGERKGGWGSVEVVDDESPVHSCKSLVTK